MPHTIDFERVQLLSDTLLAQGTSLLRNVPHNSFQHLNSTNAGIYLISLDSAPKYIGEAANLKTRLRQQFNQRTSTFYRNYLQNHTEIPIESFTVRSLDVGIGRKELEEFGIVNIPCSLNRFRRDKRKRQTDGAAEELWSTVQESRSALLENAEAVAMTAPTILGSIAAPPALPGLYIVRSDSHQSPLYIGESSDLAERWFKAHCRSTYFSALRRHIATEVLGLTLKERNGKARYLDESEEAKVSHFLHACQISFLPIAFGRYELEHHLIQKHAPVLNRKGNLRGDQLDHS